LHRTSATTVAQKTLLQAHIFRKMFLSAYSQITSTTDMP